MSGYCYLSSAHLQGFSRYKYRSKDTSPLSNYIVNPFWNGVLKLVPMWIAPNLLTFVGWSLVIINFFLLSYYDWDYMTSTNDVGIVRPPIPAAVWVFCGISQFLSHTLDGIDGKQARRTGTSTPLGELFDHGLDSFSTILIPLCLMSAIGRGQQWGGSTYEAFGPCLALLAGFYLTHWEKYITGVLYLPWIYDIVQLGSSAAYLVTGIYGVEIWHFHIYSGWTFAKFLKWLLILGTVFSFPVSLANIYEFYTTPSTSEDSSQQQNGSSPLPPQRKLKFSEALHPWVPFVLMSIIYTAWVLLSPSGITEREPRLLFLSMGIVFSNISCRLIVAQMSGQPCELFNYLLIPLFVAFGVSLFLPLYEQYILYAYFTMVLVAHVHYGLCIVEQLCDYYHIYCFSITSKKTDSNS